MPAALKVNPSTPTRLAPAKLMSNPVYPVLSVGLVIPAGRTIANVTLPPLTLKPTAPAVLTVSSVTSRPCHGHPTAARPGKEVQVAEGYLVTPAPASTPLAPERLFLVSTSLVPWVIVKLAVPTTKPNAFKLTLPPTCNATSFFNSLLKLGNSPAVSVAVAHRSAEPPPLPPQWSPC